MTGREQIIRDWQERLAESEAELEQVSPQRRWIKQVYVRLLRFLLAVYGHADWTTAPADTPSADSENDGSPADVGRVPLVDLRDDGVGTPPKSAAHIRATLDALHAEVDPEVAVGPHTHGMGQDDWIVVASERDGVAVRRFSRALLLSDIPHRRRRMGSNIVVEVPYRHEEEALDKLRLLGRSVRVRVGGRFQRGLPAPWVLGGGLAGALLSLLAGSMFLDWSSVSDWAEGVCAAIALMCLGSIPGFLVGYVMGRVFGPDDWI